MLPVSTPRIILASASPRRRELLAYLGVTFEVVPADLDESTTETDPTRTAEELALRKVEAVAPRFPDAIVIGSDTIVALEGQMLGKPTDADEARTMLRALRGRTHEVLTGVAATLNDRNLSAVSRATVEMRHYSDDEIEAWIASGAAHDKAGGYASQDPVFRPALHVDGCACGVIGLPLWTLREVLANLSVEVTPPELDRCITCPARNEE